MNTPHAATVSLIEQVLNLAHAPGTGTATVTVTPDIATRLLATVDLDVSRPLNGRQVQTLAHAMREGTFSDRDSMLDPLTFTSEGRLRNGKRRLVALIFTGTTHTFTATLHREP